MANIPLRVVIDTNIIVRAVSGGSLSSSIFDALLNQQYILCVTTILNNVVVPNNSIQSFI